MAAAGGFGGRGNRRPVGAGSYKVVLTVDGKEYVQQLRVINDPNLSVAESMALEEQLLLESLSEEDEGEESEEEREEQEARSRRIGKIDD